MSERSGGRWESEESQVSRGKIATIPNFLTLIRACGIPLFLCLFLHDHRPTLSFLVLTIGAITDYFDGKIARWLKQESAFGAAFDPFIDRLYIVSTIVAMAIEGYLPWWLVAILIARDIWMLGALALYRKRTGKNFVVTFLGKAATFNLLYAFPFILLQGVPTFGEKARVLNGEPLHGARELFHLLGWAFAWWGVGLYLFTAVLYSRQSFTRKLR